MGENLVNDVMQKILDDNLIGHAEARVLAGAILDYLEAERAIRADGLLIFEERTGDTVGHPALAVRDRAVRILSDAIDSGRDLDGAFAVCQAGMTEDVDADDE